MTINNRRIKGEVLVMMLLMVATLVVMVSLVVAEMRPTGGVYIPTHDKCEKDRK